MRKPQPHGSSLKNQRCASGSSATIPTISDGCDAAFATVRLMAQAADRLPANRLIDEYVRVAGGSSAAMGMVWGALLETISQS